MRARNVKVKGFTAATLVPATPPAGDSLEELLNAWFKTAGEIELLELQYSFDATAGVYTALVSYTV